jgi:hypothetical protein
MMFAVNNEWNKSSEVGGRSVNQATAAAGNKSHRCDFFWASRYTHHTKTKWAKP